MVQSSTSDDLINLFPKIPGVRSERDKQHISQLEDLSISELAEKGPDSRKFRRALGSLAL